MPEPIPLTSRIATAVYKACIRSDGLRLRLWQRVRCWLIDNFDDPPTVMLVHGQRLEMPLSHGLPAYLAGNPHYDTLPSRLGALIRAHSGALIAIDVGANIGDTIAAFDCDANDYFVAVEPNPKFHAYLRRNWPDAARVRPVQALCAADSGSGRFSFREYAGTASARMDGTGQALPTTTVDGLVASDSRLHALNLLKVDTDGHDFEVLRGATDALSTHRPAILFECDPFGNQNYLTDLRATLNRLEEAGYRRFVTYDNRGRLMGCHVLSAPRGFYRDVFRQLVTQDLYFDILLLRDELMDEFLAAEIVHFRAQAPEPSIAWPADLAPFDE